MKRKLEQVGLAFTLYQVAMVLRAHWNTIPRADRDRAAELVMRSGLRPSSLSPAERAELRELAGAMRLPVLGRQLASIALAKRRGRR